MPTKITWADETWNPISGCTKISEGCKNCYAEKMSRRQVAIGFARHERGIGNDDTWIAYSNAIDPDTGRWSGQITCRPEKLYEPLRWRKPRRVFVCSMSDLFHEDVPTAFIGRVLNVIAQMAIHTSFLLLTKRPRRMLDVLSRYYEMFNRNHPLKNIWAGVTAENQRRADERIPILLQIPAVVRFVSVEPMLEWMDIFTALYTDDEWEQTMPVLDWVIVGGESGPGARPMRKEWVRAMRNQCQAAGVPFLFKQQVINGKKVSLPELDGKVWNQYPETR